MRAGVHRARRLGGEGEARVFFERQRIDVGAPEQVRAGQGAADERGDAGVRDWPQILCADARERVDDQRLRSMLFGRKLRVPMQLAADRDGICGERIHPRTQRPNVISRRRSHRTQA